MVCTGCLHNDPKSHTSDLPDKRDVLELLIARAMQLLFKVSYTLNVLVNVFNKSASEDRMSSREGWFKYMFERGRDVEDDK